MKTDLDIPYGCGSGKAHLLPESQVNGMGLSDNSWRKSLYLTTGDIFTSASIGALAGLLTPWVVRPGWNMLAAMAVGMGVGVGLQVLVFLFFMPLFGSMEVMIPSMIAGMVGGMSCAMMAALYLLPSRLGFLWGGAIGIMVGLWVRFRSQELQGDAS